MSQMSINRPLAVSCAGLMAFSLWTTEVRARGFDTGLAIGVGAAIIGGLIAGSVANSGQQGKSAKTKSAKASAKSGKSKRGGESKGTADSATSDTAVLASLSAPGSKVSLPILATFKSSSLVGAVGAVAEADKILNLKQRDEERDYTAKIQQILRQFDEQNKAERAGDVTQHGIVTALEEAFRKSNLDLFESFLNENWTAERLRVMILDRVIADLPALFAGNNRGLAPMSVVQSLIERSADGVYARLFESSELLAANRSILTFLRRVYEAQGSATLPPSSNAASRASDVTDAEIRASQDLKDNADRILSQAAKQAMTRFEAAFRRDPNSYALRYRAQRVVYDCLSDHVEQITVSASGTKTSEVSEIERRAAKIALNDCAEWLVNTFGESREKVTEQKPMPIRVIWSESGPRDDPQLYGRTNRNF